MNRFEQHIDSEIHAGLRAIGRESLVCITDFTRGGETPFVKQLDSRCPVPLPVVGGWGLYVALSLIARGEDARVVLEGEFGA